METVGKYSAMEIADYILLKYKEHNITPLKLQKLLFYVKAWSIVAGKPLIKEDFQAWKFGPVCTEVYHKFKENKDHNILFPKTNPYIEEESKELIDFILKNYINYSGGQLSELTHSEDPWIKTNANCIIKEELIKDYYSKLPFAKNFTEKTGFYPVLEPLFYSFIFDMDKQTQKFLETKKVFSSFEEFDQIQQSIKKEVLEFLKTKINA